MAMKIALLKTISRKNCTNCRKSAKTVMFLPHNFYCLRCRTSINNFPTICNFACNHIYNYGV